MFTAFDYLIYSFCTGATIGAAQLDSLYEKAVLRRLQLAERSETLGLADLHQAAWEMRISKEYQK